MIANEFKETNSIHRLLSPTSVPIDIVPFGDIAEQSAQIRWPPSGDVVMTVLGFAEALASAAQVTIADGVSIAVATPPSMALLKLIAWSEREGVRQQVDAADLIYLAARYEDIPAVSDRAYETHIAEKFDWDITLASAYLLGWDARAIAEPKTIKYLLDLIGDDEFTTKLLRDALGREIFSTQAIEALLSAFVEGFTKS